MATPTAPAPELISYEVIDRVAVLGMRKAPVNTLGFETPTCSIQNHASSHIYPCKPGSDW